jgi:hypothetical protein
MSERRWNLGLVVLCLLVFLQICCFFLNAADNLLATFRLTFVGHKGAALVKPVVNLQNVAQIGTLLTWFYFICCIVFVVLLLGMGARRPIFFRILVVLDVISLFLGLYGYYFWLTGGAHLTVSEQVITLTEPCLSSGGLLLLLCVTNVRTFWWPRRRSI